MLPPLPAWDAIHPIVVHFPIALLFVAPLAILAGMALARFRPVLWGVGLALLLLGTASAMLAVRTGEAGEDAAERVAGAEAVLHEHEELAESATQFFIVLTLVFGALYAASLVPKWRERHGVFVACAAVFLLLHGAAATRLAWAGHEGGRLVHELGVRAPMAGAPSAAARAGGDAEQDD